MFTHLSLPSVRRICQSLVCGMSYSLLTPSSIVGLAAWIVWDWIISFNLEARSMVMMMSYFMLTLIYGSGQTLLEEETGEYGMD